MALVKLSVDDGCAVLTLNAPERRNLLTIDLSQELLKLVRQAEADESVKGLIITGEGSAFSGGGDLGELLAASEGSGEEIREIYSGFLAVANCRLPTIAAVNGPAIGAGMNLALACDVRIAAESARFDTRFLAIGIHPGGGHTWMLQRAVGWQEASAMLLFGEPLTGQQALEKGLVLDCVPNNELLARAKSLVAKTKHYPRELLLQTKQSMQQTRWHSVHADAVDLEYEVQMDSLRQPEAKAALTALYEKIKGGR